MQAIHSTKQGLQLQHIEKPIPKNDEILVKVHTASVTAGDVVMKKMPAIAFLVLQFMGMKRKRTPGHEFSGIIEAVGQDVTRFTVGDAVFGTTTGLRVGANAEYIALPETGKTHIITHKPETISFEQAAALLVGAMTALQILQKADVQVGQKVLIYGASGSVGTYAVQLAKYFGAEVTGVCSTRNIEMVKSIGADHIVDYKQEDFKQNGTKYDVIFDTVGKISKKDVKQSLTNNSRYVSTKTMTHETPENLSLIAQLAQEGHLKAVIDRCYPLAETADAYHYVESGRKSGNVVIKVLS
jgi:NADPH:quinone reductase-like Zn-dependent oxidoreductase